ncbi:hypothetical protein FGB62_22g018 [Gracilaria domingensis]|nr:hypothetical protein FGB62_22g018 [Gracilaria domingensis]
MISIVGTKAFHSAFRFSCRQIHIRSWQFSSAPQGSLRILLPLACNLSISTLDPHQSDWTRTNVHLHVPTSESLSEDEARNVATKLDVRVGQELEEGSSARIEASVVPSDQELDNLFVKHIPELRVEIPGLHNLWIELAQGSIRLRDTIEGDLRIISESAAVFVSKLRSTSARIKTKNGNIEARILHGNLNIEAQAGAVKLAKAQGNDIKVQCGGQIKAGSLYGGRLTLRSGSGLSADAIHGEADIEAKGAVISALQGSLKLKSKGNACLTLADTGTELVDVDVDGDLHLGVSKGLDATYDLKANSVRDEIGVLHERERGGTLDGESCSVHVKATGSVTLRDEQWAGRMLGLASGRS